MICLSHWQKNCEKCWNHSTVRLLLFTQLSSVLLCHCTVVLFKTLFQCWSWPLLGVLPSGSCLVGSTRWLLCFYATGYLRLPRMHGVAEMTMWITNLEHCSHARPTCPTDSPPCSSPSFPFLSLTLPVSLAQSSLLNALSILQKWWIDWTPVSLWEMSLLMWQTGLVPYSSVSLQITDYGGCCVHGGTSASFPKVKRSAKWVVNINLFPVSFRSSSVHLSAFHSLSWSPFHRPFHPLSHTLGLFSATIVLALSLLISSSFILLIYLSVCTTIITAQRRTDVMKRYQSQTDWQMLHELALGRMGRSESLRVFRD